MQDDNTPILHRYTSLTFIDFMEALGRVADMKTLPTASDLADSGFASIMEWALEKERYEVKPIATSLTPLHKTRQALCCMSHCAAIADGRLPVHSTSWWCLCHFALMHLAHHEAVTCCRLRVAVVEVLMAVQTAAACLRSSARVPAAVWMHPSPGRYMRSWSC